MNSLHQNKAINVFLINVTEWEFEFTQRDRHTFLMADIWCRSFSAEFHDAFRLATTKLDHCITSLAHGYVKREHLRIVLQKLRVSVQDPAYRNYIRVQTENCCDELAAFEEKVKREKVDEKTSDARLALLWQEYVLVFRRLIPWFTIPWYAIEHNMLTDNVREILATKEKELPASLFDSLVACTTFTAETAFNNEQKSFYKLVKITKEVGVKATGREQTIAKPTYLEMKKKEYLTKFGWMKTFYMLPIDVLTLEELNARIADAIVQRSDETFALARKRSLENKKIAAKIEQLFSSEKEALQLMKDAQSISRAMVVSVEESLRISYSLQPFIKSIAERLRVTHEELLAFTVDEIIAALEGKHPLQKKIVKERMQGYVFVCENGVCQWESGLQAKVLAEQIDMQIRNPSPAILSDHNTQTKIIKGVCGNPGTANGTAFVALTPAAASHIKEGQILVCAMTSPDYVPAMKRAAAIVTDEGGLLCHAAIVGRELGKPCVIATRNGTKLLRTGDAISVDSTKGIVTILNKKKE